MRSERECCRDTQLSILQNHLSDSVHEMTENQRENARLVQNGEIRPICDAGFRPEAITYDANYLDWQRARSHSGEQFNDAATCQTDYGMSRIGRLEDLTPVGGVERKVPARLIGGTL